MRIQKLLKIAIPSYKTREATMIFILSALLVLRTYMSIWISDINGNIVKSIVDRNPDRFVRGVSENLK